MTEQTFKVGVLSAVKEMKRKKTFKKTNAERLQAFQELIDKLCEIYEVPKIHVDTDVDPNTYHIHESRGFLGVTQNEEAEYVIQLGMKLSIISLLQGFAAIRFNFNRDKAVNWSLELFQRCYPKQYERLSMEGHACVVPDGTEESSEPQPMLN